MLRWAVLFLVIALIAGFFGFYGVEGTAFEGAKILFVVFLILAVLSMVFGSLSRTTTRLRESGSDGRTGVSSSS